jgi:hypothetical protein
MEPADMVDAVAASMQARTGRTVSGWVQAVTDAGLDPLDQLAVRRWLKDSHGIPQNSQWAIAFAAAEQAGWVRPSADGYADTLYAGRSAPLPRLELAKGFAQATHWVHLPGSSPVAEAATLEPLLAAAYLQNG